MISILLLIVGLVIGYKIDYLERQVKLLQVKPKTQNPTVTMGSYDKVDEFNKVNTDSEVGIVEIKTPQLLSWEEQERVKRGIEHV